MYYSDKPISFENEDLFHRSGFAKLLAKSIIDMNNADTYTIGLYGKWGHGKTSLVNMTLHEIENQQNNSDDKNIIIVHFEPWNFSDTTQLLNQFFIRLSNKFSSKEDKNLQKIGAAIQSYASAFEFLEVINPWLKVIPVLSEIAGEKMQRGPEGKDILHQKEIIVNLLKKQSHRILVVMDDIDRLSNEQIRQVFQLITSVAKFPNTTYLLAFDKEIVVKALEKVQEGYGEDYLEKIIQMPIQIPDIRYDDLRSVLFTRLDDIYESNKSVGFDERHWTKIYTKCIEPYVKNIRDVNRLCNIVQFKLVGIASEIDFADMVAISTIELILPQIYNWIKVHKGILVGDDMKSILSNESQSKLYEDYKNQLRPLLRETDFDEEDNSVITVIDALSELFPYWGNKIGRCYTVYDENIHRRFNHIAHLEKFDRYFQLDIDGVLLKTYDVTRAITTLSYEDLKDFILEQSENKCAFEFIEEVKAMLPNIPYERIQIIIRSIISTEIFIDDTKVKTIVSVPYRWYAEYVIVELLEKLPANERYLFICECLESAGENEVQALAHLINRCELGYGRLSANGTERDFKKIVTLDELVTLETLFCNKTKLLLETYNLFDFKDWRIICHLMEYFDKTYIEEYLTQAFKVDVNIVIYLCATITSWHGSGVSYEVTSDYTKYLSKERVTAAINNLKETGALFELSEEVQSKCAAFFLEVIENNSYVDHVPQKEIDNLLASWKKALA